MYGHGQLWDRRWRLTFSKGLAIANNIGLEQASKHPDECCFACAVLAKEDNDLRLSIATAFDRKIEREREVPPK